MQLTHRRVSDDAHAITIPVSIIKEAAVWLSRIQEKPLNSAEQQDLLKWRMQSKQHERAWQRAENLSDTFHHIPVDLGMSVLARPQSPDRRAILKSIAVWLVATPAGIVAYKQFPWQNWTADYQTAKGEQRTLQLADGGKLIINTDSAIDIDYNEQERLVRLYQGEIYIETAHDAYKRVFIVETEHGRLHALGTKFVVRKYDSNTYIGVIQGAVDVLPKDHASQHLVVNAGQETKFTADTYFTPMSLNDNSTTWLDGIIYADNMPLPEFVAMLSRYRKGVIHCDSSVADVHVSGAFQLKNPDRVLEIIQKTRPVRIDWRTRYWATLYKTS